MGEDKDGLRSPLAIANPAKLPANENQSFVTLAPIPNNILRVFVTFRGQDHFGQPILAIGTSALAK